MPHFIQKTLFFILFHSFKRVASLKKLCFFATLFVCFAPDPYHPCYGFESKLFFLPPLLNSAFFWSAAAIMGLGRYVYNLTDFKASYS